MKFQQGDHVVDYVDDYLHEVLSPAEHVYVQQHVETCSICRVALTEAEKRFAALRTATMLEAPQALVEDTLRRVEAARRREHGWRGKVRPRPMLAVAAMLGLVALGAAHIYYATLSPTPYDLRLIGQREMFADSAASLRVQLVDASRNNAPVRGADVTIALRDASAGRDFQLVSFVTDAAGTGTPQFHLPDWKDGQYELRVTARPGWHSETVSHTITLKRSSKLMLSSDKPIYQPGQVIHLRSLALRKPDLHPLASQQAVFTIADPKGNVIFKQQAATSRYGIASADCPLADEILEGAYTVACRIGDTESRLTVDVKKYVLPKFKIQVRLDKPYYQPGELVCGDVEANYFFGQPVADGTVDVELLPAGPPQAALSRASARTHLQGRTGFRIRLPDVLAGRPQDSGDARLSVRVTLRDPAGQEYVCSTPCLVTSQPLRIEVIPEAGQIAPGIDNDVYVLATYADGTPAKARLAIAGDDSVRLATDGQRDLQTGGLGVASFVLRPRQDGPVVLTIRATDERGLSANRTVTLGTSPRRDTLLLRTNKAVYNGGETVHAIVVANGGVVFLDFIKDGQTLLTQTIQTSNGTGACQFDLPADVSGTIQLCAYRFSPDGYAIRKTSTIYVRQARELKVVAAADSAEYRPGDKARLTLSLTDPAGQPVPGAISLAAVDEAVFSVLPAAPGMERTFFALDEQLLKPIYEICPWSPEPRADVTADQQAEYEKALFSRTACDTWQDSPQVQQYLGQGPRGNQVRRWNVDGTFNQEAFEQAGRPEGIFAARGPHTLSLASYDVKRVQVHQQRHTHLEGVHLAWLVIGIPLGLVLAFCLFGRGAVAVLVVLVIGLLLMSIMLPALGKARELSSLSAEAYRSGQFGRGPVPAAQLVAPTGPPAGVIDEIGSLAEPPRIREWFPETLLWKPELITDDAGQISIDVDLADSITTWRLTAGAVSADGRLGGATSSIRVFQPFFVDLNLPVSLTRGDEVAVPAVVYNYLDKPQTVQLDLAAAQEGAAGDRWFEPLDATTQRVELAPRQVRSTSFRIRAARAGKFDLQVTARSGEVADAIKRNIEVVPDGRRIEHVVNGYLPQEQPIDLEIPAGAIPDSARAILKIYPSRFSQLVEGLDGIFQRPYGCFEQTSSTTYPNVLALDYLKRTGQAMPAVEATARQYIHLGYQRLLGFEVAGGGFDWFGRAPANTTLTAYGLMEFEDMAKVHDVDSRLIERTRRWLLAKRSGDGSWSPESHGMHDDPTTRGRDARLAATAYIAWAVFRDGAAPEQADATLTCMTGVAPMAIDSPYTLALVCNALMAMDPSGQTAVPYLDRLAQLRRTSPDGRRCWWTCDAGARTTFYGSGQAGQIETTALAAQAMIRAHSDPVGVRGALAWLIEQKDARGTWHSTQATVLALRALITGTDEPLGEGQERRIQVLLDDKPLREVRIPADQSEVMQQIDLTPHVSAGRHHLRLLDAANSSACYQVTQRYHVPSEPAIADRQPLAIDIQYDRLELQVGQSVAVTATITNRTKRAAPMIVLDLPIPPGFAISPEDLDAARAAGLIDRYQLAPRSAIVYLRSLAPDKPLVLKYQLHAIMPVRVTASAGKAYEYYDPQQSAESQPQLLTVRPAADSITPS